MAARTNLDEYQLLSREQLIDLARMNGRFALSLDDALANSTTQLAGLIRMPGADLLQHQKQ